MLCPCLIGRALARMSRHPRVRRLRQVRAVPRQDQVRWPKPDEAKVRHEAEEGETEGGCGQRRLRRLRRRRVFARQQDCVLRHVRRGPPSELLAASSRKNSRRDVGVPFLQPAGANRPAPDLAAREGANCGRRRDARLGPGALDARGTTVGSRTLRCPMRTTGIHRQRRARGGAMCVRQRNGAVRCRDEPVRDECARVAGVWRHGRVPVQRAAVVGQRGRRSTPAVRSR